MKSESGVGGQPIKPGAADKAIVEPKIGDEFMSMRIEPSRQLPSSRIHFDVHPGMPELRAYAAEKGWLRAGFSHLTIPWQELVFTTDAWATKQSVKSTDVPSPLVNAFFNLPNVPKGTTIEFAIHVGIACHAPGDAAGYRERGELWLNNAGKNFTQVTQ